MQEKEKCFKYECKMKRINLYWIIGFLGIIILGLITFIIYIKQNESVSIGDLISISSGLVSIALAVIAIIYAISESIKTKDDGKRSEIILEKVKSVLDEVKTGLDKSNNVLDEVRDKTDSVKQRVEDISEEYKNVNKSDFNQVIVENSVDDLESKEDKDELETGKISSDIKEASELKVEDIINPLENKAKEENELKAKRQKEYLDNIQKNSSENYIYRDTSVRGDIFYADLSPVIGFEQGGIRPVVIIQNDIANRYSPTISVAPITSQIDRAKLPTHVEIPSSKYNLRRDSVILLEQVRTIDKKRLKEQIDSVSEYDMKKIEKALLIQFNLLGEK